MKEFLISVADYIAFTFTADLAELSVLNIILAAVLIIIALKILKQIAKGILKIFTFSKKGVKNMSAKSRCAKIQCRHCGRTLDRCICDANKGKSYSYRMKNHKKETKEIKKRQNMIKEK